MIWHLNCLECFTASHPTNAAMAKVGHPVPFQRELAKGSAQSEASQYVNIIKSNTSPEALAADDFTKMTRLFSATMDTRWLIGERLEAYKTEWGREGRLRGVTNWYRASPLNVADVGVPIDDLPALPVEKLKVHCDHLLIWGMNDTALLPQTTQGLEDHCARLKRVEIEDADHWILHQKPVEVADAIIDWVIGNDFYIP